MEDGSKVRILLLLAYCYGMVGKFQQAIQCCHKVQTLYTVAPDVEERRNLLTALMLMMDIYADQGLHHDAMKMYEQILHFLNEENLKENLSNEMLGLFNSSGILLIKITQYNKAKRILRSIIDILRNQQKHNFGYFMCLNNLGVVLLNQDRLTEAKAILNYALGIGSELYGENAIHPYFALCLTNLSEVHYYLRNIEEADRLLQLALITYSNVHEHELIEPNIINALIIKARIHQFYKRWDEMFEFLEKAKEIAEILYAGQPHPNVVSLYFYLGCCEQERGKFLEALNYYQEYLKIHENCRIECQQNRYGCSTSNILMRIANLGKHCSCDTSYRLSCIEKALEIEEKFHGKDSNHRHLAICLLSLGLCLITANRQSEGLEYLCKAMQMFKEINLDGTRVYGYAQLIVGRLLGEHSPNKAENHLKTAESVLKKTLKDNNHVTFLQINSSLLKIFLQTNRVQDGLELAKQQRQLVDVMLSKPSAPTAQELCQVLRLAEFYEAGGRKNTAKEMYIDLITRLEKQVDPTDSEKYYLMFLLWTTQQRLGEIYQSNEMFCDAEAMFRRIASSVQKATSQQPFVKEAPHFTLWPMASIFTDTGRYQQAHQLLGSLINIYEKNPKSIDANIASSAFFTRGELNRRCRRFNPALQDLNKALKIAGHFRATTNRNAMLAKTNEIYYANIMNSIGLVYEQTRNPERALEYYRCCLNTVEGIPPTTDITTFHQNAADMLKKLGRLDDALAHYQKCLEIREMLHSEDPIREDIATVLYHIAIVQYTDGRQKDASETLDKLIPLRKELLKNGSSISLQNYCAVFILKGNCHIVQPDEAQQAKDAYEEAEKVLKPLTEGQPNLDYAIVTSNLGMTYKLHIF
jgi:tetratricopeptide (TPR) repeat protein